MPDDASEYILERENMDVRVLDRPVHPPGRMPQEMCNPQWPQMPGRG